MSKLEYLSSIPQHAESFAISKIFQSNESSILFISKDDREIFNIKEKLTWLLPNIEILIYRSWDQIPYDNVSPSKEIQSERIRTLIKLATKNKKIILTSVNAIVQKTINKSYLDKNHCIAVPTETVYGLAGNAYSNKAVKKIFELKKKTCE